MEKAYFRSPALEVDSETLTATYGKFTAEPSSAGSHDDRQQRARVLLSRDRGAAVTALRIEG